MEPKDHIDSKSKEIIFSKNISCYVLWFCPCFILMLEDISSINL